MGALRSLHTNGSKGSFRMTELLLRFAQKQKEIHEWLNTLEHQLELPLYSSVDIRDAGFKMAVVDTNLFPAGFNNLCEHGLEDSVDVMRESILKRVSQCKTVLIIAEEHTRNAWYLENARVLQDLIQKAGFTAILATFFDENPLCSDPGFLDMTTATGQSVRMYCVRQLSQRIEKKELNIDLILLNNDLSAGIPNILRDIKIPIYPSIQAGWHSRLKSYHFRHTSDLVKEFAQILGVDPWLFLCLDRVITGVNINENKDRERLAKIVEDLFREIGEKYQQHGLKEKPFVFLKADNGTYGMGVMAFESPQEILELNRKERNKLYKGKSSQVIHRYLLQEGVSTTHRVRDQIAEICVYQISNRLVGGFYRLHSEKTDRENLNSKGMEFQKICPHLEKYGHCDGRENINHFDLYRVLARIAGIAAHREIIQLEQNGGV